jgi:dephospho-CoA kinase
MLGRVAVTGGIASGKSTACRIFKELGAYVVSADDIVHQLLTPNSPVGRNVIKLLGDGIIVDNVIDRNKIAEIVFNQPPLLHSLESLIHPAVLDEIDKNYLTAQQQKNVTLFVAEIPLLFEMGAEKRFDNSVCVLSDYDSCVKRYIQSTGRTKEEFDKRMSYQMSPENKAKKASWTVNNNGSINAMIESIKNIYPSLVSNKNPNIA